MRLSIREWAFGFQGAGIQVILLVVVLIVALLHFRFWCRYACPVNFMIESLAKVRNFCFGVVNRFPGAPKTKSTGGKSS